MLRRTLVLAALIGTALLAAAAPAAAHRWVEGAPGAGDPFFPNAGNGGYDVRHYALALDYEPSTEVLSGRAAVFTRDREPEELQPRPAPVPGGVARDRERAPGALVARATTSS